MPKIIVKISRIKIGVFERWLSGTTIVGMTGFSGLGGFGVDFLALELLLSFIFVNRRNGEPLDNGRFSTLTDWRKKGDLLPRDWCEAEGVESAR